MKESNVLWSLDSASLTGRRSLRLDAVTLEIQKGITAVLGQSGAGKTSLLNLLVGFETPSSGRVTHCGHKPDDRLAVFWVPPQHGLWPHLTVREHLTTVSPAKSNAADSLLAQFDLLDLANAKPNSLSLGESSRLNVARALFSGADALVMDEPLSHVDSSRCSRYWDVVREACATNSTSLVFSTHMPEVVLREAENVICLENGCVSYCGRVNDLYERPNSETLATMLGPCNWLTQEDIEAWCSSPFTNSEPADGLGSKSNNCVRPERLDVVSVPSSPIRVETSRFAGTASEIVLHDERSGTVRNFVYRPRGTFRPKTGDRVVLKFLLFLFLIGFVGCFQDTSPPLVIKHETNWLMPPEGPRVPAPRGMTVSPDEEYLVLDNVGRVLVYNRSGDVERYWWMPEYSVGKAEGICVLKDGRIAVADTHYHRVVLFDHDGNFSGMFGQHGSEPGDFVYPVKVTQDPEEFLYVCEYGHNDRVQKFRPDGTFVLQFGGSGTDPGKFQRPCGIVWFDHLLYVVDAFNNRVQIFQDDGTFVGLLGNSEQTVEVYYPYDIAVDLRGDLYVVEYGAGRVSKFSRRGQLLGRYGKTGPGKTTEQFSTPWGLAIDRRGWLYVCDTGNRRIVELEQ